MEEWIHQLIAHLPYLGVLLALMAGGFGLPVPEDIPLLIGGYCCGIGLANIWIMVPVAFFSVMVGDATVFILGRRYGHHVSRLPVLGRYLTPSRLNRAQESFHAHGGKTLFMARFMPGLRAAVFFSAGAFKIPYWKMLAFDGTAALLSVPTWVLMAWYFAEDLEKVKTWAASLNVGIIGCFVLVGMSLVAWKLLRRRRLASVG